MTRKLIRSLTAVLAGVVLLGGTAFAQGNTSVDITVTNSATPAGSRTLKFGVNTSASLGIDATLGEESFPPFPPSSVFEARFVPFSQALAGTEGSPRDYRPSTSATQSDTFHIKFQAGTGGLPLTLSWSTSSVSSQYTSATLKDVFGGALGINVNMLTTGSLSISNGSITELELITTGPIGAAEGISVAGCPLDFGIVQIPTPGSATRNLTISRAGTDPVVIDSVTSSNPDFTITAPVSFPQTVNASPLTVSVLYTATTSGPATSTITVHFDGSETYTCQASALASSGEGLFFVTPLDTVPDNSTGHSSKIGLKYSGATPAQGVQFTIQVPNNVKKVTGLTLGSDITSPLDWIFDYEVTNAFTGSEIAVLLYGRDTTVNLPANTENLLVVQYEAANVKLCNGTTGGDDTTVVMYLDDVQSALATELGESAGIGVDPNRDTAASYIHNGSARGDVNCDDRVDVLDLLIVNDFILGRGDLEQWQKNRVDLAEWSATWAAGTVFNDANNYGDATVNVQDLVLMINAILNESWPDSDPLWSIGAPIGEGNGGMVELKDDASTGTLAKRSAIYDVKFIYEVSNNGIEVKMESKAPVKGYQMKLKAADIPVELMVQHVGNIETPFQVNHIVVDDEIRIVAFTANGEPIAPMNGTLMTIPFAISNTGVVAVIEPITVGGPNNESLKVEYEVVAKVSGVAGDEVADAFALANMPNPFTGATAISYTLPAAGDVTLVVTDANGREVARLLAGERQTAGDHTVEFDAAALPSGVYYYTLSTNETSASRRMVLAR